MLNAMGSLFEPTNPHCKRDARCTAAGMGEYLGSCGMVWVWQMGEGTKMRGGGGRGGGTLCAIKNTQACAN